MKRTKPEPSKREEPKEKKTARKPYRYGVSKILVNYESQ